MEYNPGDATGGVPPVEPPPPTPYPPAPYPPAPVSGGLSQNNAAALAYLTFIPAIIFLVMEPYNKNAFIRFHAFQCIAFSVVAFAIHLVLMFIPIIGWAISLLLTLVFFILWIMCIMKASKGEWYKLPIIGDFALAQSRSA
jgi:uncharacterized membrane protein